MDEYIKRKEEAPRVIYLQWKDDFGEVLGGTTWCFERIYVHDIRYIIDKRHLTSRRSRATGTCAYCEAKVYGGGKICWFHRINPPPA